MHSLGNLPGRAAGQGGEKFQGKGNSMGARESYIILDLFLQPFKNIPNNESLISFPRERKSTVE